MLVCFLSPREFPVNVSEEVQRAGWSYLLPVEQTEVFLKDGAAPEHCKLKLLRPMSNPSQRQNLPSSEWGESTFEATENPKALKSC